MIQMNVSRFGFAARALACDSWGGGVMCDIRDSIRKAREAFLIQKGKTIDPAGLNIREETY